MDKREFDLIIFGGSGFTAFFVIRELLLSIDQFKLELKWAVAGRNLERLQDTLNQISRELNKDLSSIVKIIADVENKLALADMAKRTRLVVNCVGPYYLWGRPVVMACVEAGTHHIDISGEPQYIENMQLEFHQQASDKNALIISTCGWDSIPCDLGTDFLKRNFDGRLHSVETFMHLQNGPHGYSVNFGTLNSIIYGYIHMKELRSLRQKLFSQVLSKKIRPSRIILKRKYIPFKHSDIDGYNVEFPGSDRSVVKRTQYYNYQHFNEPPVQIQTYFTISSLINLFKLAIGAVIFAALNLNSLSRRLLQSYPKFFTAGYFSHQGPTRPQIDSTIFQLTLVGKGWSKKALNGLIDPEIEPHTKLDKSIIAKVTGPDPGYLGTSICLIQSALTILFERESMPSGGVLTPASAFKNTQIIERLEKRGVKFEIISK